MYEKIAKFLHNKEKTLDIWVEFPFTTFRCLQLNLSSTIVLCITWDAGTGRLYIYIVSISSKCLYVDIYIGS